MYFDTQLLSALGTPGTSFVFSSESERMNLKVTGSSTTLLLPRALFTWLKFFKTMHQ
jgi:hypothetical protein